MTASRTSVAMAIALALLLAACLSGDSLAPASSPPEPTLPRIDERPLIRSPISPTGLQAFLGTADLGVGANRVAFVLVSPDELITTPQAVVLSLYYGDESPTGESRESAYADFHLGPYGSRGLYATNLTFDRAGPWGMEFRVGQADGSERKTQLLFEVKEVADTPAIGSPAPPSRNKTVRDVTSLEELASGSMLDPDLYQLTIAAAKDTGRPSVIVFASPAFCINEVCGPQVEVLQELKDRYRGRANFIHVDLYDNPHEIQGDLRQSRISPIVEEWNLPSIEWTFVLDQEGTIAAKFEAFATFGEVQEALNLVLE